jgi:ribonuclease M5
MEIGNRPRKLGYIVEGFNDERSILDVDPDAVVIVTKGTRFDKRVKIAIEKAIEECEMVFIMTDPDEPGESLAEKIKNKYWDLPRVEIAADRAEAFRHNFTKKKIGVEHCEPDYLKEVIVHAYCEEKFKYETTPYQIVRAKLNDGFYDGESMHLNFQNDLFKQYGVENHPKRERCFGLAWEHGHSAGYTEVLSYFDEFVELIT